MDKHIEVEDVHHVTSKQKGKIQIKMCGDNIDNFIATLHNVLLAQDLCDRLFSMILLINSRHTCHFTKGFVWCTLVTRRKMRLLYHIVHSGNMHFGGK